MPAEVPTYDAYMMPIIERLKVRGGSMTNEEMAEDVAAAMSLTDEQKSLPHGQTGRSEVEYRMAWARTYLKKAGAIENSERGVWRLTPLGTTMTAQHVRAVPRQVMQAYAETRSAKPGAAAATEGELEEATWVERLLGRMQAMPAVAFERLCQRLLREAGFAKVEVTGRSGDGGIDGTGVLRVNLLSFHVLFQCKRWKGTVGSSTIRDFRGAMVGRTDKGLIITTGTFSSDAKREAVRDGAPAIELIDGEALCELLKDLRVGVKVTMVPEVTIDEAAFQSF